MFERVLRRIQSPEINLHQVHRDTGLGLKWLQALRAGRFKDPGVKKIEQLDNYFRTGAQA